MAISAKSELIITFGHRSNDWAITTRDHPLVAASGQVWPVINVLVEMSFFASPTATQRRLSDRSRRQRLKNGEKGSKWSIRCYCGCDVTSMPKESTWSLSTAPYVGSMKLTYDRSERLDRGFDKPENNLIDHATLMFTKLRWLSWKSSARELGVSQQLRQPQSGIFVIDGARNTREDGEEVRCVLHDGKRKLYRSPNTPCCWNSNLAMELTRAQRTTHQTQRRPSLPPSLRASARPSSHYQALDHAFSGFFLWKEQQMLVL